MSIDTDMGFALYYAPHVDVLTQIVVTCAINAYLLAVDSEEGKPDPKLLPQWCLSRSEIVREVCEGGV